MTTKKKWIVKQPKPITKILKRLGSVERSRYLQLLEDFRDSDDPAKFGKLEIIKGVKVYVARLNISYRVVYYIIHPDKTIVILAVGDHKEVGLKE
ncbi:MAG: type II toxin-antitoxin system RelE/ParE family toxin [Candidatus Nitrosocosmicus sp.]